MNIQYKSQLGNHKQYWLREKDAEICSFPPFLTYMPPKLEETTKKYFFFTDFLVEIPLKESPLVYLHAFLSHSPYQHLSVNKYTRSYKCPILSMCFLWPDYENHTCLRIKCPETGAKKHFQIMQYNFLKSAPPNWIRKTCYRFSTQHVS